MNKKISQYVKKIANKAVIVNEQTEHDVWLDFSGHVDKFEVDVILGGWEHDKDKDISLSFYTDEAFEQRDAQRILLVLNKLLNDTYELDESDNEDKTLIRNLERINKYLGEDGIT